MRLRYSGKDKLIPKSSLGAYPIYDNNSGGGWQDDRWEKAGDLATLRAKFQQCGVSRYFLEC